MLALNRRMRGSVMTTRGIGALLSLAASILPAQSRRAPQPRLAIVNVAVIDATGSAVQHHKTVLVAGDRIDAIVDAKALLPKGSRIVRGDGKFLIPGLWDMHVHLTERDLPILVAYGVTSVRDMGNVLADVDVWRGKIAAGAFVGPHILRVGPILNGMEYGPVQLTVENEAQARTAVRVLKKAGVDAIKLHAALPRDAYFALADEAKKQSIPFVGHVPRSVTPLEASNAGQASLEHIQTIFEGQSPPKPDSEPQLFAAFAKNGTAYDPTLVAYRGSTEAQNVDPELVRTYPDLIPGRKKFFARFLELVGVMNREHVTLLAGSDLSTNFKWLLPGASLHDELGLLVAAGLSPMEALQTATRNPGRFLHVDAGTIEVGRQADLVLLDANPLDDIHNTRKIRAVVLDGKLLDRSHLDALGRH
jgi:imidazolonepropionase-like amidohydrolase